MNFTPLYETDKIMLGILEIFSDDFCQTEHSKYNDRLYKKSCLLEKRGLTDDLFDSGKVQTVSHIVDSRQSTSL